MVLALHVFTASGVVQHEAYSNDTILSDCASVRTHAILLMVMDHARCEPMAKVSETAGTARTHDILLMVMDHARCEPMAKVSETAATAAIL